MFQVYRGYQTYIVPHEVIQPNGLFHSNYKIKMLIMCIITYDQ